MSLHHRTSDALSHLKEEQTKFVKGCQTFIHVYARCQPKVTAVIYDYSDEIINTTFSVVYNQIGYLKAKNKDWHGKVYSLKGHYVVLLRIF